MWASRSYFGKGDDRYPQGDWKAEFDGLQKALNTGSDEAAQQPAKAAETQAENGAVYTPMGDLASP